MRILPQNYFAKRVASASQRSLPSDGFIVLAAASPHELTSPLPYTHLVLPAPRFQTGAQRRSF